MKFRKITSIVLTLSLLLSSLTVYSFGLEEKPDEGNEYSSEGVYVVCEESEKCGKYEKHFITSDSKFIAVSYPEQMQTRIFLVITCLHIAGITLKTIPMPTAIFQFQIG